MGAGGISGSIVSQKTGEESTSKRKWPLSKIRMQTWRLSLARSRSWATLVRAVSVTRCEREADWSVLRREWEDGSREWIIDFSCEREWTNGGRGSSDVGQVKVFFFLFFVFCFQEG